MIIANPIYDVVFKRLMEDNRIAKFFIGTLLEQTIEAVEVQPQEFTYANELVGLTVFRLDFIATIRTDAGEIKKVLIEIQKVKNQIDLMRFRNYLGEQYKKEDLVDNIKTILPITTIYVLGFKLPEIKTPCLKVERNYRDLVDKKIIEVKSDFVEKLTHDSYIVQVDRITDRYQTRLDKLLSIFEQKNFVDDTRITKRFDHETDLEEVKLITEILHYTGIDPDEKRKIEIEKEAWRTVEALNEDVTRKLNESLKVISEQNEIIEELRRKLGEE